MSPLPALTARAQLPTGGSADERLATLSALLDGGYEVRVGGEPAPDRVAIDPAAGADAALAAIDAAREAAAQPQPKAWKPWFPVIDYERCTDCMQCLSFCLFDVYGVDENNHIEVQNPANCKTDCPACSRVCPDVAILFPKYKAGPLNGAPLDEADLKREAMKVDISALLGGDIYQALRERSAHARSRFSKERSDDKALKERQRCLKKLKGDLDVPAEVLSSLPSPAEIQARAAEAKAKAAAALAAQEQKPAPDEESP